MASIKEFFEGLKEKVAAPEAMKGTTAVYQFNLHGEGGGEYYIKFDNGAGSITKGEHAKPSLKVSMSASDFQDLIDGKQNVTAAFMSGKIKISGDMSLAFKLQPLLG